MPSLEEFLKREKATSMSFIFPLNCGEIFHFEKEVNLPSWVGLISIGYILSTILFKASLC